MNSIPQGPDLVLDELPGGTGQLVHAPDAGHVLAVDAGGIGGAGVLAHKDGGHLDPLAAEITYLGGGIVHAVGPAVIPAQRIFRAGRDAAAVIGGGIRQQDEQVAGSRAGVKIQQVAARRARPSRFQPEAKYWLTPCHCLSLKCLSTRSTV